MSKSTVSKTEVQVEVAPSESARETADSIVVAFILAFVFRAFVIEAFIIPTGSMAATLYGKHGTIVCQDCDWEFAYGLNDTPQKQAGVTASSRAVCPNCGHANTPLPINDPAGNAQPGDRILVLKWPLDLGWDFLGPQRWDVTVFKCPTNGTDNYIKRLVGLPNEVVEILDGDVYSAPVSSLSEDSLKTLEMRVHANFLMRKYQQEPRTKNEIEDYRQQISGEIDMRTPALTADLDRRLRIQRKTKDAQDSLWSVVYDHDYLPRSVDAHQPRWEKVGRGPSHWDASGRQVRFSGLGASEESIELGGKTPIRDEYGYDIGNRGPANEVNDLRLRFVLVPHEFQGSVTLRLGHGDDLFFARMTADGSAELLRRSPKGRDAPESLARGNLGPWFKDRPRQIEFRNVDYRVSLYVDGQEVLATTDEQYAPTIAQFRNAPRKQTSPPLISSENADIELWHLAVERDVYYTPAAIASSGSNRPPTQFINGLSGWASPDNLIWLREGEYFMLGDNSPLSQDSRFWGTVGSHLLSRGEDYQCGTVPYDQLIGRAFFVYWPNGLRTDLIPGLRNIGWIPNVGRMRWIR